MTTNDITAEELRQLQKLADFIEAKGQEIFGKKQGFVIAVLNRETGGVGYISNGTLPGAFWLMSEARERIRHDHRQELMQQGGFKSS